jgi:hypothetical protein
MKDLLRMEGLPVTDLKSTRVLGEFKCDSPNHGGFEDRVRQVLPRDCPVCPLNEGGGAVLLADVTTSMSNLRSTAHRRTNMTTMSSLRDERDRPSGLIGVAQD